MLCIIKTRVDESHVDLKIVKDGQIKAFALTYAKGDSLICQGILSIVFYGTCATSKPFYSIVVRYGIGQYFHMFIGGD